MKTLHLSILTIVGIIIIVATSVGVFMEKLSDNSGSLYTGVMITGMKENYTLNEPIAFSVMVHGYGSGCGDTKVILTKENDSQYKSQVWGVGRQCMSFTNPTKFEFDGLSANTTIDQTGDYIITASFDDSVTYHHTITEVKFAVTEPKIASIFDTGIYPFTVGVTNANFIIPYNISGNNKLLDANMDSQSKSLILSLQSTNNGTLIVSIPRALLDIKKNDRGMGEFYMLTDGQETTFKEIHTTLTDRVFSIPFQNGTKNIDIIAIELI